MNDFTNRIGKLLSLLPEKYLYGATAIAVVAIVGGIGNTVFNPPGSNNAGVASQGDNEIITIEGSRAVPVPDSIASGNIFRTQRKDTEEADDNNMVMEGNEVPEITLRGIIIGGDKKIAIVDGQVKKYIKIETGPSYKLSGAAFQAAKQRGETFRLIPVGEETLSGESFTEGDLLSGYILEQIFEEKIQLVHTRSGKMVEIYLNPEDHKKKMAQQLSKAPDPVVSSVGSNNPRPHVSGSR